MELTKEDWYILLEEDFKRDNEKYDTLKVLSVHNFPDKLRCNYKTTRGDFCTSFGVMDIKKKDIPSLLRGLKIKKILSK